MEIKKFTEDDPNLLVSPGFISFSGYRAYLVQAEEIAHYIRGLELTEDNLKEVKGKLADARKVVTELNDRRIAIKKQMMKPYDDFEVMVKNLVSIVNEADEELRAKVREIEEQERQSKKEQLREIWDKRSAMYSFPSIIENAFDLWLPKKALNKTSSLKSSESDMVYWMEKTEHDIETLMKMGEEYVAEYAICHDITAAIDVIEYRKKVSSYVSEMAKENGMVSATFRVNGEKDIALAELLMKNNNINFERI